MSTGTETTCFSGNFEPGTGWDAWVKYPFFPGYALVGEVAELGPGATTLRVGQVVVSRCGHASEHVKPESECYPVPSGMDPKLMSWFALAKIAAMGARAAAHRLGESVVVIGAGPVGQMAVRWAAATGPEHLLVVDTVEKRLEMAMHGGATLGIAKPIEGAQAEITAALGGGQPDLVIDATGNSLVFRSALRTARHRGRVLLLGDTGHPDQQHMVQELVVRGLTLVGAHDGNEDEQWNTPRILRLFFRLVRDGMFRLDGLITHEFRPQQCAEAYALAAFRRPETMGILFDWRTEP
jgi:2-desacetyl-2-hydroxyethyl bacteriochlorophyllide A dehydrogenase